MYGQFRRGTCNLDGHTCDKTANFVLFATHKLYAKVRVNIVNIHWDIILGLSDLAV